MAKGKGGKEGSKEGKAKDKGKEKGTPPTKKLSPQEIQKIEEELLKIFARQRYTEMDGIFKQVTPSGRLILLLPKIHIFEEWHFLPPTPQLCGQHPILYPKEGINSDVNDSADGIKPQKFMKPCILKGVVYINTHMIKDYEQVFVEVCARLRYNSSDLTDPLQPLLSSVVLDSRDYLRLYPLDVDRIVETDDLNQRLFKKCYAELPKFKPFPFQFDISMRQDSVKFNRPGENPISGIVWECTVYIGPQRNLRVDDDTCTIEFCKYTYAPILDPESPLRLSPVESSRRYATFCDAGEVVLEARIPQDLYYHGDFIPVTVSVTNTSNRLSLSGVIVTVEQVIRTYKDALQELNIIVAEEYFEPDTPQSGLPVSAKQKTWTRQVFLQPVVDPMRHKYNLLMEGRLSTEREFLASSSIILYPDFVDRSGIFKAPEMPYEMEEGVDHAMPTQQSSSLSQVRRIAEPFILPPLFSEVHHEGGKGGKVGKSKGGKEGKRGKEGKSGKKGKNKNKSNANPSADGNRLGFPSTNVSNAKKGKGKGKAEGKEGKGKGKEHSPKKTGPYPAIEKLIHNNIEYALVNRDPNRALFVTYDIVVRLNLSLLEGGGVGGHPVVRLPFVLTRKTTLNPLSHSGLPEGLFDPPPDPRVGAGAKKSPSKESPGGKKKGGESPGKKKK